jgi:hypothetical protein
MSSGVARQQSFAEKNRALHANPIKYDKTVFSSRWALRVGAAVDVS